MVLSFRRRQLRERAASGEPAERIQSGHGMVSGQTERRIAARDSAGLCECKQHNRLMVDVFAVTVRLISKLIDPFCETETAQECRRQSALLVRNGRRRILHQSSVGVADVADCRRRQADQHRRSNPVSGRCDGGIHNR